MSRPRAESLRTGHRRRPARVASALLVCAFALVTAAAFTPPAFAAAPAPATLQSPPAGVEPPVGSGSFTPAATPAPVPASTYAPGTGGRLYADNCSGCHGVRGEGLVGPPLAAAGFADLVGPIIVEGGIGMPAFSGVLPERDVDAISVFVADELADPAARTAEVAPGGDLFRLYCSGCHGSAGGGGAMARLNNAPNIRQYPPAMAIAAMILGRGNMPSFAGNTFDVRQQAAVARYVQVIDEPPSPGGAGLGFLGPVSEGAVGGLVLFLLILVAVWLAWPSRKAAP